MGSRHYTKRDTQFRYHRGTNRAVRPRTFDSEEKAKAWAEAQGIKKYEFVNIKSAESKRKKIRIECQ